ncbi:hypothetical protein B5807_02691 [Epicoccum nigrum]|uniref:Uncharacterized protein n=1 Tax=Epicoccum nigrum TaxID=105696 RepID=A0A1Y2M7U6_EPING|nr:hypothetical protein B5807_02691 [Epicoccum nigrum]
MKIRLRFTGKLNILDRSTCGVHNLEPRDHSLEGCYTVNSPLHHFITSALPFRPYTPTTLDNLQNCQADLSALLKCTIFFTLYNLRQFQHLPPQRLQSTFNIKSNVKFRPAASKMDESRGSGTARAS